MDLILTSDSAALEWSHNLMPAQFDNAKYICLYLEEPSNMKLVDIDYHLSKETY